MLTFILSRLRPPRRRPPPPPPPPALGCPPRELRGKVKYPAAPLRSSKIMFLNVMNESSSLKASTPSLPARHLTCLRSVDSAGRPGPAGRAGGATRSARRHARAASDGGREGSACVGAPAAAGGRGGAEAAPAAPVGLRSRAASGAPPPPLHPSGPRRPLSATPLSEAVGKAGVGDRDGAGRAAMALMGRGALRQGRRAPAPRVRRAPRASCPATRPTGRRRRSRRSCTRHSARETTAGRLTSSAARRRTRCATTDCSDRR